MAEKLIDILPESLRAGLTPTEQELLAKAQEGEPLDLQKGDKELDNPENAPQWDESRSIRSELLSCICTDRKAAELVHRRGVRIAGAKITGPLDLSFAVIPHPLALIECAAEEIILLSAEARSLNFGGSYTGPINADGLKTGGAVFLNYGFKAVGEVRLLGADIGGQLSCSKGTFENEEGDALSADGLKTGGNVFLDKGDR